MQSLVKIACLVIFHTLAIRAQSQNVSSIAGKVIDKQTKEPLPFAAVYLAKTTLGVATNLDGTFLFDKIPKGKYDLTVSMLGYRTFSQPILFSPSVIDGIVIELESQPQELDDVTIVSSKIKRNQSLFPEFKKYFLGQTRNAMLCSISNPKDVFIYRQDKKLIALTSSSKPIEVINEALGYKLIYELKEFELDYKQKHVVTSGIPRFEELVPEDASQKVRWTLERDRAYYGSFEHFLVSLLHGKLAENYFFIKDNEGNLLSEADLVKNDVLTYSGTLYVTYSHEPPEFQTSNEVVQSQNSLIECSGKPITIYDNGNFEEFHDLVLNGYFGWISHIGELLPYGYQPAYKIDLIR